MQPYLNQIIQGDTLNILKKLPADYIDLGITSPPYNKGEKNKGWLVKNVLYDSVVDNKSEVNYQSEQIEVLNELFRIIKPGGSFFYNHKTRWEKGKMLHPMEWLLKTNWTIRQEIIWDRMIAANIRGWRFWQVDERIYWLYKPINENKIGTEIISKHAKLTSIWRFSPERNNSHPAPFPIELPARIIHSILNEKEGIVIDPYSGSGTTAVAAKILNKNYIGIEISKPYIEQSEQRLLNYYLDKKNIDIEISKHFVIDKFKDRKTKGAWLHKTTHKKIVENINLFSTSI